MRVNKPWGHEIRWAVNDKYVGKLLRIEPGQKLSRQYHQEKDETIYVLDGKLVLELGTMEKPAGCGEIAKKAGLPTSKVVPRMKGLLKDGLVERPVEGKYVISKQGRKAASALS